MRIPARPPNWHAIFKQLDPSRLGHLLQSTHGVGHNDRYVHWDKLRHLTPPKGLSHQEWWVALKTRRYSQYRSLPVLDVKGEPFRYVLADPAPQLLHGLDKETAGQILISEPIGASSVRDQYVVRSLMEEAITSSQLEGAATTRQVAKEMLRTGRRPRTRDEQMIANNYRAMRTIRSLRDKPLTPDVIFTLHRILTEDTLDDPTGAGRLRRPDEDIVVEDNEGEVLHCPPHAGELESRLGRLCDLANGVIPDEFIHPVVRAILLHFQLAYDHPFIDGNGRCARALFYWSMLSSGYWLTEFISISQFLRRAPIRYGRAFLYTETDDNDFTYFILFHLEVLHKAVGELQAYIKRKMAEVRDAEKLVRTSDNFNHRQLALLSNALRHPDAQYTLAGHQTSHNVVYETARKDLLDLVARGLLESRKVGKAFHFYPVPNLDRAMKRQK